MATAAMAAGPKSEPEWVRQSRALAAATPTARPPAGAAAVDASHVNLYACTTAAGEHHSHGSSCSCCSEPTFSPPRPRQSTPADQYRPQPGQPAFVPDNGARTCPQEEPREPPRASSSSQASVTASLLQRAKQFGKRFQDSPLSPGKAKQPRQSPAAAAGSAQPASFADQFYACVQKGLSLPAKSVGVLVDKLSPSKKKPKEPS